MAYKSKENQRLATRRHYLKNKLIYIERAKLGKLKSIARNRRFLYEYLLIHPCVDCKETNPIVLEFDHDKNKQKENNISNMMCNGVSLSKLQLELNKCVVRCANCHRIKTAREENWWINRRGVEQSGRSTAS